MFFPRKDHDGEATYLFFADTQPKGHIPDVIACLATDDPESLDSGFNQSPRPSALLMEHSRGLFSRPGLIGYRIQNGGFVDHTGIEAGAGWSTRFTLDDVAESDDGVIVIRASDHDAELELATEIERMTGGALRIRHTIRNTGTGIYMLERLDVSVPIDLECCEILDFSGRHMNERNPQRHRIQDGDWVREFRRGKPGFDGAVLYAGTPGFGFNTGTVLCLQPAWSGNTELAVCRGSEDGPMAYVGELLLPGEVQLAEGDSYSTPWVVVSASSHGLDPIMQGLHRWERTLPSHPTRQPVTLNVWEAVYMGQNREVLADIARRAASIGVERYVLDDGWFHLRRTDSSGLGDWWIDRDVWPEGLDELIELVHSEGMQFGLWFEPEMVNPDSDVARAHPDWVLRPTANRLPMQGRSQQVLDLTNPDAYRYIHDSIDALVGELGIDYIKWDHNKFVTEAVSPRTGRPAVHGQTLAVYRMFRDLEVAHPGLEIESCASGGGRIDLGILEFASRVWTSDCVDPVERADIQRYTSLLVPPCMMGEHVGASPAHSTHRATSQEMRMAMAFFGHMGVEWNLLKEPDEALNKLGEWVAEYKRHRAWFAIDTCVHADIADPAVRVDGMVKPDRSAAFYRFTQLTTSQTLPAAPIRVPGLDPDGTYRIQPLWLDLDLDGLGLGSGQSPLGWWTKDGVLMTGRALMTYGLRPPSLHPAQSVLFTAIRQ